MQPLPVVRVGGVEALVNVTTSSGHTADAGSAAMANTGGTETSKNPALMKGVKPQALLARAVT